jgi:hypothetical protein
VSVERETALKRGGGYRLVPLDLVLAERELPAAPEPAEEAFEREWALGLMDRALERLRAEYEDGPRKGRAEVVLRFFALAEAPTYTEAAAACGMTVPQWKATLHRARARFREILREEVAATVEDDGEGEDRPPARGDEQEQRVGGGEPEEDRRGLEVHAGAVAAAVAGGFEVGVDAAAELAEETVAGTELHAGAMGGILRGRRQ